MQLYGESIHKSFKAFRFRIGYILTKILSSLISILCAPCISKESPENLTKITKNILFPDVDAD